VQTNPSVFYVTNRYISLQSRRVHRCPHPSKCECRGGRGGRIVGVAIGTNRCPELSRVCEDSTLPQSYPGESHRYHLDDPQLELSPLACFSMDRRASPVTTSKEASTSMDRQESPMATSQEASISFDSRASFRAGHSIQRAGSSNPYREEDFSSPLVTSAALNS
jgi:hypothetical protein